MSRTSQIEQARQMGWRVLPLPVFVPACRSSTGQGSAARVCFRHPREWVVIPPEDHPAPVRTIRGRVRAVRWALSQAATSKVLSG